MMSMMVEEEQDTSIVVEVAGSPAKAPGWAALLPGRVDDVGDHLGNSWLCNLINT